MGCQSAAFSQRLEKDVLFFPTKAANEPFHCEITSGSCALERPWDSMRFLDSNVAWTQPSPLQVPWWPGAGVGCFCCLQRAKHNYTGNWIERWQSQRVLFLPTAGVVEISKSCFSSKLWMGPPPTADCNKAVCSFKTLDDTFRNCSLLFQSLPSKQATSITSHDCCLESLGNSGILWTFAVPFRSANKHLVQMMAFDALPCLPWAKWDTSTAFCEYLSTKHLISLHCMISSSMLFAALAIQTQLALSSASFDPPSWAKTQLLLLRVPAQHHNACSLNAVAHYFALFRPRNVVIFGRAMSWQPCHALFWGFLKPTPQPLTFECSENRFDDLRWIWFLVWHWQLAIGSTFVLECWKAALASSRLYCIQNEASARKPPLSYSVLSRKSYSSVSVA